MNVVPVRKPTYTEEYDEILVLVDPEPLSRDCFAEVLQAAFPRLLVLTARDTSDIDQTADLPVALVLLRVSLEARPGSVAPRVAAIRGRLPHAPVVVIGPGCDHELTAEAMEAGTRGVLPSSEPLKVVIAAVQLIMAGGTYYPVHIKPEAVGLDRRNSDPVAVRRAMERANEAASHKGDDAGPAEATQDLCAKFTGREVQVLAALQQGRSNKWIASELNLSENTVKVYIKHIMRKLNATNRTQAAIYSQDIGNRATGPAVG
jgi:DNA-binding NarL/FixJ family response regulator